MFPRDLPSILSHFIVKAKTNGKHLVGILSSVFQSMTSYCLKLLAIQTQDCFVATSMEDFQLTNWSGRLPLMYAVQAIPGVTAPP